MERDHPWVLAAPSYDWPASGNPRKTPPSIQKYESANFVEDFLRDPRSSVAYNSDDFVQALGGTESEPVFETTATRKLFLPSHKRFYLVVVELHCDVPGLPSASREDVCEAGFVVRRLRGESGVDRWKRATWAGAGGAPVGFDSIGAWTHTDTADETPERDLDELTFSLHPLVPDPRVERHPAKGRTMYFGMISTTSAETDEYGRPALDEQTRYQIRCFVRRHPKGCPPKIAVGMCHGPLVWSAPSEVFQLASFYDPTGTSYPTVHIRMPAVRELKAAAARQLRPAVTMETPEGSALAVGDGSPAKPFFMGLTTESCSFSIPLITIVATFVFQIFLSILLPFLSFLLSFKFCIPPPGLVPALPLPPPQGPSSTPGPQGKDPGTASLKVGVTVAAHANGGAS